MSDPIAKAERSHAKDIRQGLVDQRPVGTKNKRERPFVVQFRGDPESHLFFVRKQTTWRTWGKYRTEDEASKAMAGLVRKYSFYEFRLDNH